jgi:hypothetical protein
VHITATEDGSKSVQRYRGISNSFLLIFRAYHILVVEGGVSTKTVTMLTTWVTVTTPGLSAMIGLVMKAAVDIPAMTGLTASLKILPPRAASSTFGIRLTTAGKIEVTGFTVLETIFPPPFPTTGTDKTGTRTEVAADMMLVRTPFMIDGTGVATGNTIAVASLKMLDIRP